MRRNKGVLAALAIVGEIENAINDWHRIYHQPEVHAQFLWAKIYTYCKETPEKSRQDICQIPWASWGYTPTSHANDSMSLWPPITGPLFVRPVTSVPGCSACLGAWPKQLFSFRWHGPGSQIMNSGVSRTTGHGPMWGQVSAGNVTLQDYIYNDVIY